MQTGPNSTIVTLLRIARCDALESFRQVAIGVSTYTALLAFLVMRYRCDLVLASTGPSPVEILAWLLLGSMDFDMPNGASFAIPPAWLAISMALPCITGFYSSAAMNGRGCQILIRCRSFRLWWISKVLWMAMCEVVVVASTLLIIVLFSDHETPIYALRTEIVFYGLTFSGALTADMLDFAAAAQIIVMVVMGAMQMTLSLFVGAPASLAIVLAYLVLSCYVGGFPFVADCGMLLRIDSMMGWDSLCPLIFLVAVGLFAIVVLPFTIKERDYLICRNH